MNDTRPGPDRAAASLPAPDLLNPRQSLFLDFDGTLVAIAAAPERILVSRELPHLLHGLSHWLGGALALISGRSIDDLSRRLTPFAPALAGLHGLERRRADGVIIRDPVEPALRRAHPALAEFAAHHEGVRLEDKGGSLALHYRCSPELEPASRDLVRRAAAAEAGVLSALDGKMVTELIPRHSGKGRAIAAFLAEPPFRGREPVFVGDDVTDEDGFGIVNSLGGMSVHVGDTATAARFRLATVSDVLEWLERSLAP